MDNMTVFKRINYLYKCSNCGSDSEGPSHSIRVEIDGPDHNFGFNLCPECAIRISSKMRMSGEYTARYRGIDPTAMDHWHEEYHSTKNNIWKLEEEGETE